MHICERVRTNKRFDSLKKSGATVSTNIPKGLRLSPDEYRKKGN
jgi:hypothetical protein